MKNFHSLFLPITHTHTHVRVYFVISHYIPPLHLFIPGNIFQIPHVYFEFKRLIEQSFLLHRNVLRDKVMGKKILMRPTMILIPADWLHQDQVQPLAFRSSKLVQN